MLFMPVSELIRAAFGEEDVDVGIPFEVAPEGVQNADERRGFAIKLTVNTLGNGGEKDSGASSNRGGRRYGASREW